MHQLYTKALLHIDREMLDWCSAKFDNHNKNNSRWKSFLTHAHPEYFQSYWQFENREDCILFELTWADHIIETP